MSALVGARDRQEEWETAGSFVDGCRALVEQVASWLNHATTRARAGLNLFELQDSTGTRYYWPYSTNGSRPTGEP